jgi:hypothetical protein
MNDLLFSSLSSEQQAQAASIFLDKYFGTRAADYVYEVDAANGGILGRHPLSIVHTDGKGRSANFNITTTGQLHFTDSIGEHFSRLILDLIVQEELVQL